MKRFGYILLVHFALFLVPSCSMTALQPLQTDKSEIQSRPVCETSFIGFKNLKVSKKMFKTFLGEMTSAKIADDNSAFYSGDFSMEELSRYRDNTHSYATYIDVDKFYYTHNDAVDDREGLEIAGWCVAACTVFTLFPVYVPMFCCARKNSSLISMVGHFNIVVFDISSRECVCTIPVDIEREDKYKGQYAHKNTNMEEVDLYYQTLLSNALIEGYEKAEDFIKSHR